MHSIHYVPLVADKSYTTNGYLESSINWVPGINEILLRDFPSFFRTHTTLCCRFCRWSVGELSMLLQSFWTHWSFRVWYFGGTFVHFFPPQWSLNFTRESCH